MKKVLFVLFLLCGLVYACVKENATSQEIPAQTTVSVDSSDYQVLNEVTERVSPITGWASQTGYLDNLSTTQTTILGLVAGYSGLSSGQSVTYSGAVFLTDCAGGDGTRIRNAIQDYHNWFVSAPTKNACNNPSVPSSIITSMKNRLSATYNTADRTQIVNKIIANYNVWKCANPNSVFTVPATDNATLSFLGIRKQCLEWACTLAGTSVGYSGPYVSSQTSFRRGMGLYQYTNQNGVWKGSHAMIITDIYWTVNNGVTTATKFKVAESNWSTGWSNPNGAIPWTREISVGRIVTYSGSPSMKVVSFG